MEQFLQQYGAYLADGAVVVAIVLVLVLFWRKLAADRDLAGLGTGLSREVKRTLLAQKRAGNEFAVAEILFNSKRYDQAAELYAKLNNPGRAAEAYELGGKKAMAIQAFKRAGQHERAAQVALKHKMYAIAGKTYMELERFGEAADCYAKARDLPKAAELYSKAGRTDQAGEIFEKLKNYDQAAEMYVTYFKEQYRLARGHIESMPEAASMARRAAQLLVQLGKSLEAAELLRRAGFNREAGALFEKIGALEEAARTFAEVGEGLKAAELLEKLGKPKEAAKCRAEVRIEAGDRVGAAEELARAEEYLKAGELLLEAGERDHAARMFSEAGDHLAAAEIWAQDGKLEAAAEAFGNGGEYDQAARLMESVGRQDKAAKYWKLAGDVLKAASIYYKVGREKAALKLLSQVSEYGESARQARAMEGQILFKLGKPKRALESFKAALGDEAPAKSNVDLHYKLGRCYEAIGEKTAAFEHYETVMKHNERYADARTRLKKLDTGTSKKRATAARAPTAPANKGHTDRPKSGVRANRLAQARYEILDEIARGGMGVVYRARDKVLNRVVAYKILSDNLKSNKTAVEYFLREARASAAMSHPNIVTVFDAGEQDNEYYMAMEYVEGETLKSLVKRQGAFPEPLVRFVAVHGCRGLAYAHDKGLVHRDIKSGNLMLTKDRSLKIMDFGLAKFIEDAQVDHTRAIGTPYYMSPEQILGKELDGRSDIYSLGITLFECATGRVPFHKGDLAYHHLHTPPPTVRSLNPEASLELERTIGKCIRKTPEERFQSATELKRISMIPVPNKS